MNKPKILFRSLNSVKISWNGISSLEQPESEAFVLELFDTVRGWKQAFWGYSTQCTITNLYPCTCYSFRLKREFQEDWLYFKAATDIEPFLIRHMTRAVKFAKIPLLKKLVQARPILLEFENNDFKTPLMQVAESGDLNLATILINLGANVNLETIHTKKTALMFAIMHGNLKIAEHLIEKGADINCKDNNDFNILHYAVNANNLESVMFCLKIGIDINSRDNMGFTPILRAVILNANEEIVKILLENGANPFLKDRGGFDFEKHCFMLDKSHLCKLITHKITPIINLPDDQEL